MSGHSKFHNIKARKGAQDAKRGQIFTKIAREIMVAVKEGGPSPDTNIKLKMAIQKGRDNSMPNDTIQSAIKRASGAQEGANYEEIVYEGYAPGGVALLVECLTDNRNRTVSEVKTAFTKHNGNLGTTGSVSYLFDRKGQLIIAKEGATEDQIMEIALEAGAEDIKTDDEEAFEVITDPADYVAVREAFEKAGISFINAEITKIPQTTNLITDAKIGKQILKIIDKLEECDDVQKVYSNYELDESIEDEVNA